MGSKHVIHCPKRTYAIVYVLDHVKQNKHASAADVTICAKAHLFMS
ncbi:hypothetical protein EDO6_05759 [Paenibacillus xylanexedens]|nr:hypothetical protein EDO6_05759 [Paenibacillus xylanexedens]